MKIKELEFVEFISEEQVQRKVERLASEINAHYAGRLPVFLPVLNGSFMFAADLIRAITIPCKVSFVKVSSYEGTGSTGQLKTILGLEASLRSQDVIIVEDIVDTGLTLKKMIGELKNFDIRSVAVVSLLRKKPAREKGIEVTYTGFEIDNQFVLGYGLDYDGLGRNYRQIYQLSTDGKTEMAWS
jgi:hypoxanthine phosphoribosyltransferase